MDDAYQQTTQGIAVTVRPEFLPEHSDPAAGRYLWAYHVRIANTGAQTAQLLHRTWVITDARGKVQRVHGPGVIGEQPVLRPGEVFEYTSGTPLETPDGFMTGTYHMIDSATGVAFDVAIPAFSLDSQPPVGRLH